MLVLTHMTQWARHHMLQGFAADAVVSQGSGGYKARAGAMPATIQWDTTVGGRHPWSQQLSGTSQSIAEAAITLSPACTAKYCQVCTLSCTVTL